MNFLAHLFLSGESKELQVGNFIGDWVKGNKYMHYPDEIRQGILLHRQLDSYTDTHPLTKSVSTRFKGEYGRYSGIITDVVYDHFLATCFSNYSIYSLNCYASMVYRNLLTHYKFLPPKVKSFIFKLISCNRLVSYKSISGLENALTIMAKHTTFPDKATNGIAVLKESYNEIQEECTCFISEAIAFVGQEFNITIPQPPQPNCQLKG